MSDYDNQNKNHHPELKADGWRLMSSGMWVLLNSTAGEMTFDDAKKVDKAIQNWGAKDA